MAAQEVCGGLLGELWLEVDHKLLALHVGAAQCTKHISAAVQFSAPCGLCGDALVCHLQ